MKRLCFGALLKIIYDAKIYGPNQRDICDAMLGVFGECLHSAEDATATRLKKGTDNLSPSVVEAASQSTFESAVQNISRLISYIKIDRQKPVVRAIKAILREDTTIAEDTIIGYVKGYEKSNIINTTTCTFNELLANVLYYATTNIKNATCADSLKEIPKNYVDGFIVGEDVFFETVATEALLPIKKTISNDNFNRVFVKANEATLSGVSNPSTVQFFMVSMANYEFKFRDLKAYILEHIGEYVFSRAKIASMENGGQSHSIGLKAMLELISKNKTGDVWADSTLGEILLYVFLENVLGAPKIMSKIEIKNEGGKISSKCDGVHLLTTMDAGLPCHQLVFGASDIVGDLTVAIDRALQKMTEMQDNADNELQLVDNTIYDNIYGDETTKYMEKIIFPQSPGTAKPDMSFGAFLGYTLNIPSEGLSFGQYRLAVQEKIKTDIEAVKPYILRKLQELKLEGYSFYFYVLPFNDAPVEKTQIMTELFSGGV